MDFWKAWEMLTPCWRAEDIFSGWTWAMLRDWGASDYELIYRRADLAALQLGRALGFGDDSEEVRQAEMLFAAVFLRRRHRNELL